MAPNPISPRRTHKSQSLSTLFCAETSEPPPPGMLPAQSQPVVFRSIEFQLDLKPRRKQCKMVPNPAVLLHLTQFQLVEASLFYTTRWYKAKMGPLFPGKTWTSLSYPAPGVALDREMSTNVQLSSVLLAVLFPKHFFVSSAGFSCERLSSNLSSFLEQLKLNLPSSNDSEPIGPVRKRISLASDSQSTSFPPRFCYPLFPPP